MKKIILKPKAITLVFLFFGILAVLIPVVVVLGASRQNPNQLSWQIDAGTQIFVDLKSAGTLSTNFCVANNNSAGKSYLVPYKTLLEWNSFVTATHTNTSMGLSVTSCAYCGDGICNGSDTTATCPNDCAPSCDSTPANVYTTAIYSAAKACGYGPACSVNSTQIAESYMGVNCTAGIDKWHYQQCATLLKTAGARMCQGDPCVVGIDHSDYYNTGFCVGYYDHTLRACVYTSKTVKSLPSWGGVVNVDYSPSYDDGPAVASWGTCATTPSCGNGICDSGYGET